MGRTSVALADGLDESPLVRRLAQGKPQAEGLMPLIRELMAEAGAGFGSLGLVAVSTGPGGFSGIRTGVAAARGIGLAAGLPVAGASSFRIMAAAFEWEAPAPNAYGIAAPAGVSAVFCQILAPGRSPHTGIEVLTHAEAGAFFAGRAEVISGPAATLLSDACHVAVPVRSASLFPDAGTLARLAPELDPARDLPSPYYVRPADARPQSKHLIARKED
jgi:tRNA threonylcarbamoyladenosine biosynthesis protein TsaB